MSIFYLLYWFIFNSYQLFRSTQIPRTVENVNYFVNRENRYDELVHFITGGSKSEWLFIITLHLDTLIPPAIILKTSKMCLLLTYSTVFFFRSIFTNTYATFRIGLQRRICGSGGRFFASRCCANWFTDSCSKIKILPT